MSDSKKLKSNSQLVQASGKTLFTYDAIKTSSKRRSPAKKIVTEDSLLNSKNRKKLIGTTQEQLRNIALLRWMIDHHTAYVSRFNFYIDKGVPTELASVLERLMYEAGRRDNFDVAGRLSRDEYLTIYEKTKVVGGDALTLFLDSGHVQGITPDQIVKPSSQGDMPTELYDKMTDLGLVLDDTGRVTHYCICKNNKGAYEYLKLVEAGPDACYFDGYIDRWDQTRGVSPLSSTVNLLADVYENFDATNLKMKLQNVFGVTVNRKYGTGSDWTVGNRDTSQEEKQEYDFDLKNGPFFLDMEKGDELKMHETTAPNGDIVDYSELQLRIAMCTLGIPYSCFDRKKSSFAASTADTNEYEFKCEGKRKANQAFLDAYTLWKLQEWEGSKPEFKAELDKAGLTIEGLAYAAKWVPAGKPWLNKKDEILGDIYAVAAGLESPFETMRKRGKDPEQVRADLKEFYEGYREDNTPVVVGAPGMQTVAQIDAQTEDNDESENDEGAE